MIKTKMKWLENIQIQADIELDDFDPETTICVDDLKDTHPLVYAYYKQENELRQKAFLEDFGLIDDGEV